MVEAVTKIQSKIKGESRSQTTPQHVAIVMDGNGRWARRRGFPRLVGHQRGLEALKRTAYAAIDIGIEYLTVFAFSTENWRRPQAEVKGLMTLLRRSLKNDLMDLHENNIRLRSIGSRKRVDPQLLELIDNAVELTKNNTKLNLSVAFNYGGRDEIVTASRQLAEKVKAGKMKPAEITEESFARELFTSDLPDPDLLIRTSNVIRISNFLIWQSAYTELVFLDVLWPEFTKEHLLEAIEKYQNCERKFGRASAEESA